MEDSRRYVHWTGELLEAPAFRDLPQELRLPFLAVALNAECTGSWLGLYGASLRKLSRLMGAPDETTAESYLAELQRRGLVFYDADAEVIFVPVRLELDPTCSPGAFIGIAGRILRGELPKVGREMETRLLNVLLRYGQPLLERHGSRSDLDPRSNVPRFLEVHTALMNRLTDLTDLTGEHPSQQGSQHPSQHPSQQGSEQGSQQGCEHTLLLPPTSILLPPSSERTRTREGKQKRSKRKIGRNRAAELVDSLQIEETEPEQEASKRAAKSAPTTPERDRNALGKRYKKLIEKVTKIRDDHAKLNTRAPHVAQWKIQENLPIDAKREHGLIEQIRKNLNRNHVPAYELPPLLSLTVFDMKTVPLFVDAWLAIAWWVEDWTVDDVSGELLELFESSTKKSAAAAKG